MLGFLGFVGYGNQKSIYPHAKQVLAGQNFLFKLVVRLGKQNAIALFFGGLQGPTDGGGEKVMDDLWNNHSQDGRSVFSKVDGHGIGYVLVLGGIVLDQLDGFLR